LAEKEEKTGLLAQADVISFTLIIFVFIIVAMVIATLYVALHSEDPLSVLDNLRSWIIPLISGIFVAYGVTRGDH